jgi:hypothetical protein
VHIFEIVAGLWAFGSACTVLGWLAHAKVYSVKVSMARRAAARQTAAPRV